jgi:hypothetical protein
MGSLPGVRTYSDRDPGTRTSFRSSWTQPEGVTGAIIVESQIVDLNLVNWTVDAISKFDGKKYLNIQVATPYAHFNRGEGFYVMPDVGAKCYVCIPSDGPPPFVQSFIMPMETIDGASEEAPGGTDGGKGGVTQTATAASFAGGRVRAKPGDIGITNRDGSFVRLHRGGVLQIGATELAQRIYIPLHNHVVDISENYRHQNVNGSINWFVSHGESSSNPPSVSRHTYRLLAGDQSASVRIAIGKLSDVVKEPSADTRSDLLQLGIGNEPVVCEVLLAPDTISPDDGAMKAGTSKASLLRYYFDKAGNTVYRTEGSIYMKAAGRLQMRIGSHFELYGGGNGTIEVEGVGRIQAGGGLDVSAPVFRFNAGQAPVARVGSTVTLTLPPGIPILTTAGAGTTTAPVVVTGIVTTGNPQFLV